MLPLEEDERLDNEPLLGGFFSQAESEENVQDPRDMLPASLEYLCLDTKEVQWDVLCNLFNHRNERTPLLTLDNTRLTQGDQQFGRGAASKERFDSPLLEDIWRGHNTWL